MLFPGALYKILRIFLALYVVVSLKLVCCGRGTDETVYAGIVMGLLVLFDTRVKRGKEEHSAGNDWMGQLKRENFIQKARSAITAAGFF